MVKRYTECMSRWEEGQPDMRVDPAGEYVKYTDYAALAGRCERLEVALRMARSELYGLPHSLGYEFTHLPQIDAVLGEELK